MPERLFKDVVWDRSALPRTVIVYRGVPDIRDRGGMSWTLDLDTAAWFAMRLATNNDQPTVYRLETSRDQVLLYYNGRSEEEIVLPRSVIPQARVYGSLAEWHAGFERKKKIREAR